MNEYDKNLEQNNKIYNLKKNLKQKIDADLSRYSGKTFLHTSPHHDDILLGYLPIVQYLRLHNQTKHHFAVMTSGSNSVTNEFLIERLNTLSNLAYPDCLAQDIMQIYGISDIQKCIEQIKLDLAQNNLDKILILKGKIRDREEETAWKMLGFDNSCLNFMKLGFYSDKSGEIDFERDVKPVINLIKRINPDIITLAWENEVGHPTHIKVCKIVMQAVKNYLQECPDKKLDVWGYRNVWCRFEPYQADLIFPVTLEDFTCLKNTFLASYHSQIKAATPSKEYDGPFCDFMQKIMHDQYKAVKACVGQEFFDKHQNQRIRAAQGFCFIKFIEELDRNI